MLEYGRVETRGPAYEDPQVRARHSTWTRKSPTRRRCDSSASTPTSRAREYLVQWEHDEDARRRTWQRADQFNGIDQYE
jgi:hypothetical protein